MKILITGASGRIGRSLIEWMLDHSLDSLIATSRRKPFAKCNNVKWIEGDLTEKKTLYSLFQCNPDVVIHLASSVKGRYSRSILENYQEDINPTLNLIDFIVKNKINIKFIYPSSGGTIYKDSSKPHVENEKLYPMSLYALNKVYFENLLSQYSDIFSSVVLRISNPYGMKFNSQINQGIIDKISYCIKKNEEMEIWDDIETIRDYIDINDLCSAFFKAIYYNNPRRYDIFNIGTGNGVSIK